MNFGTLIDVILLNLMRGIAKLKIIPLGTVHNYHHFHNTAKRSICGWVGSSTKNHHLLCSIFYYIGFWGGNGKKLKEIYKCLA